MRWIYLTMSILIISVLLLIYELNSLDSQYTQLIDTGTTQLSLVQRLTFNSNRRHILLFHIAHSTDSAERTRLVREQYGISKQNDSIFNALVKIDSIFPNQIKIIEAAVDARKIYASSIQSYLSKVLKSNHPYIDEAADREVDKTFLLYQKHINELYSNQSKTVITLRNLFSSNTEKKSFWIFLFTISPVLVLLLLFMALIFLVRYDFGKTYP